MSKKTIIEVRHIVTGEVVETVDVTGCPQSVIENCLRVVIGSIDDDNYCAAVAEVPHD